MEEHTRDKDTESSLCGNRCGKNSTSSRALRSLGKCMCNSTEQNDDPVDQETQDSPTNINLQPAGEENRPYPSDAKRLLLLYLYRQRETSPILANDITELRNIFLHSPNAIFGENPYDIYASGKNVALRKEGLTEEMEREAEGHKNSKIKKTKNKKTSQLSSSSNPWEPSTDPMRAGPSGSRGFLPNSLGICSACIAAQARRNKRQPLVETNSKILARRSKQILSVKCSWRYKRYIGIVPKEVRPTTYPQTPNIKQKHTRSSWMLTVKNWRTDLIIWDIKEKNPPRTKKEQFTSVLDLMRRKREDSSK